MSPIHDPQRTYQDPYHSIPLEELPPATTTTTTMFGNSKNKDPVVVKQSTIAMDEEEEEMLRRGMVDWNAMKRKETWLNRGMISSSFSSLPPHSFRVA